MPSWPTALNSALDRSVADHGASTAITARVSETLRTIAAAMSDSSHVVQVETLPRSHSSSAAPADVAVFELSKREFPISLMLRAVSVGHNTRNLGSVERR